MTKSGGHAMAWRLPALAVLSAMLVAAPTHAQSSLRYNQIQTVGTHNSYHVAPPASVLTFLTSPIVTGLLGSNSVDVPGAWEVTMQPLGQQLGNYGLRQIEIDVFADPNGTLFSTAAGQKLAGGNGTLASSEYAQSGFKVLHVPDIDWQTVSITFRDALTAVKNWSTANPDHTPLAFYVEIKNVSTDTVASVVGSANVQKINTLLGSEPGGPPYELIVPVDETTSDINTLQSDILDIIGRSSIITPDDLRGNASTLQAALITSGGQWPTLASMQGKILFVVINTYAAQYLSQFPNLASPALMFISDTQPSNAQTVFLEPVDGTVSSSDTVSDMASRVLGYVQQGYIVRARTDIDTTEARASNFTRAQALLEAGAHILSTDFPVLPTFFNSTYALQLPTALTCNPVTTNVSGTPIYSPVDYILATQPAGPPDTIPSCGAGTAFPTNLTANTASGSGSAAAPAASNETAAAPPPTPANTMAAGRTADPPPPISPPATAPTMASAPAGMPPPASLMTSSPVAGTSSSADAPSPSSTTPAPAPAPSSAHRGACLFMFCGW